LGFRSWDFSDWGLGVGISAVGGRMWGEGAGVKELGFNGWGVESTDSELAPNQEERCPRLLPAHLCVRVPGRDFGFRVPGFGFRGQVLIRFPLPS